MVRALIERNAPDSALSCVCPDAWMKVGCPLSFTQPEQVKPRKVEWFTFLIVIHFLLVTKPTTSIAHCITYVKPPICCSFWPLWITYPFASTPPRLRHSKRIKIQILCYAVWRIRFVCSGFNPSALCSPIEAGGLAFTLDSKPWSVQTNGVTPEGFTMQSRNKRPAPWSRGGSSVNATTLSKYSIYHWLLSVKG